MMVPCICMRMGTTRLRQIGCRSLMHIQSHGSSDCSQFCLVDWTYLTPISNWSEESKESTHPQGVIRIQLSRPVAIHVHMLWEACCYGESLSTKTAPSQSLPNKAMKTSCLTSTSMVPFTFASVGAQLCGWHLNVATVVCLHLQDNVSIANVSWCGWSGMVWYVSAPHADTE